MGRNGDGDPMYNLLSSIGGIDSTRFQRPQAMKDLRAQESPAKKGPGTSGTSQSAVARPPSSQPSSSYNAEAASGIVSPRLQTSQKPSGVILSQGNSNSQLDALLGDSLFSKPSR
jgi:hypothetical protein